MFSASPAFIKPYVGNLMHEFCFKFNNASIIYFILILYFYFLLFIIYSYSIFLRFTVPVSFFEHLAVPCLGLNYALYIKDVF
ncbi:hypothetical protein PCNPT3_02500 [Psychromonas sp. CNPT3]|nr:hypothetical protein PCNPT3_02500 [Psychromonas sp. CNPT3]